VVVVLKPDRGSNLPLPRKSLAKVGDNARGVRVSAKGGQAKSELALRLPMTDR
jgi:hypothetical protein